jgi:hypothetical protein
VAGITVVVLPPHCRHRWDGGVVLQPWLGPAATPTTSVSCSCGHAFLLFWCLSRSLQPVLYCRTPSSLELSLFLSISSCFGPLLDRSRVNLAIANPSVHMIWSYFSGRVFMCISCWYVCVHRMFIWAESRPIFNIWMMHTFLVKHLLYHSDLIFYLWMMQLLYGAISMRLYSASSWKFKNNVHLLKNGFTMCSTFILYTNLASKDFW